MGKIKRNVSTPKTRTKRAKPNEPTIGELSLPFFEPPCEEPGTNEKKAIMYKCRLCNPVHYQNGTKLGNLGSHMQHRHPDIYHSKIRPLTKETIKNFIECSRNRHRQWTSI